MGLCLLLVEVACSSCFFNSHFVNQFIIIAKCVFNMQIIFRLHSNKIMKIFSFSFFMCTCELYKRPVAFFFFFFFLSVLLENKMQQSNN